jgi:hypothetical protein
MKQIFIRRIGNSVTFDTVSIDNTDNVFFTNLDTQQSHWPAFDPKGEFPDFCDDELLPAPSDNSSQCIVPEGKAQVTYGCRIAGHDNERGVINIFGQLAAGDTTLKATTGQPTSQVVVKGGMAPYTITGLIVNNADIPGTSTGPGDPLTIGAGLLLDQDASGISVVGTATQPGTFNFTFTVDDSMGRNLQQIQYSLTIS